MKRVKLFLSALIAFALAVVFTLFVSADGEPACFVSSDNMWRCRLNDDNTVSVYSGLFDLPAYLGEEKDIVVPSGIDGYPVVSVEEFSFSYCDFIESVTLSEGIRELKALAFKNCNNIKRVVLPSSLEIIEDNSLPKNTDVVYTVVKGSFAESYISSSGLKTVSVDNSYQTGWKTVDGEKYYYGSDGKMVKSLLLAIGSKKYYFGKNGAMYKSRMISVNNKKYYLGKDGAAYTSRLISLDGKKYYLGKDGVAYKSKLASINGSKYYFGSDGIAYKSRLISVNNKKYYIGKDCIAYKSKFASLDGKKYYFGSDCVMRTGWRNIKDSNGVYHKYYFGKDGVARTSWRNITLSDGKTYKYYFKSNGIMVTGKNVINGKTRYFTKEGRYVPPDSPLLKKVYVYPTGKKYHYKSTCSGKNSTQITLLEAKEKGLTACKSCV